MSMVRDLIAAVIAAERNLDDQMMKLNSYQKSNEDLMRQITMELDGSVHSSSINMKEQLSQTQEQLRQTIGLLETAKTKLQRVRQI